jgi:polar amino acid transport system substrate-binding protein
MVKQVFAVFLCLCSVTPLAAAEKETTLERIKREGILRWGADPSGGAPFVFYDPNDPNKVIGFEFDLIPEIATRLARRLGIERLEPRLEKGAWDTLTNNLKAGRTDLVVNGIEITQDHAREVRLSTPYYIFEQQLTVRAEDAGRIAGLDDLKGRKIAILSGSAADRVLKQAGWTDNLILKYDDSLTPYEEVKLKRVDAALAEGIIADYYAGKDEQLHNVSRTFNPGSYAIAVRLDDVDLLDHINAVLEEMKHEGVFTRVYQKWRIWTPQQELLGIFGREQLNTEEAGQPRSVWVVLIEAAGITLVLTALAMPLALAAGLGLALMARSRKPWLSLPARGYIQLIRGTPLLVQIYLIYYMLPQLGKTLGLGDLLTWNNFVVGVLCLAANYAAYEAEIHRAGIEAVPRGQREAALSLGMSERQAFLFVVLPQSFRIILPPVLNDLIAMLKDSCLVSVIGVSELLNVALSIGKAQFAVPQLLVMAAVLYLILSLAADWLGRSLEARLKRHGFSTVSTAHH